MDELSLVPFAFSAYYVIYYLRAVWRVYKSHQRRSRTTTFLGTWLRFWLSPAILKDALRCALESLGALLGIEIAKGDSLGNDPTEDSETDHF
jgi:hypothetical protein